MDSNIFTRFSPEPEPAEHGRAIVHDRTPEHVRDLRDVRRVDHVRTRHVFRGRRQQRRTGQQTSLTTRFYVRSKILNETFIFVSPKKLSVHHLPTSYSCFECGVRETVRNTHVTHNTGYHYSRGHHPLRGIVLDIYVRSPLPPRTLAPRKEGRPGLDAKSLLFCVHALAWSLPTVIFNSHNITTTILFKLAWRQRISLPRIGFCHPPSRLCPRFGALL